MLVTIFDTETTDLIENSARRIEKQPKIIELFALTLEQVGEGEEATFIEIDSWHSLFNPKVPIPELVVGITSITDDMVRGQPVFGEKAGELKSYLTRAHRVVGHNLRYDRDMVDIELFRVGQSINWPQQVCTVEATEYKSDIFPGFRMSLGRSKKGDIGLYERLFGEQFEGAHRAEADVRGTTRCYCELVKRGMI